MPRGRHQLSSVTQSCLTLCNPMDCSTAGFLVHHQLLELAQTHVHWGSDAIQPSHPLSSPSPPAFNLPQRQGLHQEDIDINFCWQKHQSHLGGKAFEILEIFLWPFFKKNATRLFFFFFLKKKRRNFWILPFPTKYRVPGKYSNTAFLYSF